NELEELVAAPCRGFRTESVRDVLERALVAERPARGVAVGPDVELHGDDRSVRPAAPGLEIAEDRFGLEPVDPAPAVLAAGMELEQVRPDQRLPVRVAEDLDEGPVHVDEIAFGRGVEE